MNRMKRDFFPRKRVKELDGEVRAAVELLLGEMGETKIPGLSGLHRVFAVDQQRGLAYFSHDALSIPKWVFKWGTDYVIYYVAHEMAHFFARYREEKPDRGHGQKFMKWFKMICPEECQHHELDYKPRNAQAAGIARNGRLTRDDIVRKRNREMAMEIMGR